MNTTIKLILFLLFFWAINAVQLNAQVVAKFTPSQTTGCGPVLTVNFKNMSTGSGLKYNWNFGTSSIPNSTLTSPSQVFSPGTYTVTLTASANNVSSSATTVITVYKTPVANFAVSDTSGCNPLAVNFIDQTTIGSAPIAKWDWVFGDGASQNGTNQNPYHLYTVSGIKSPSLFVTDGNGCVSSVVAKAKKNIIHVSANSLNAGFDASSYINCSAPANITFANTTTGTGTLTYSWSFGDQHTSTQYSPSNTFNATGTYTVSMTVKSQSGCVRTVAKPVLVIGASNVAFTSSSKQQCIGDSLKFIDQSNPLPTAWMWDFGDGITSSKQNPYHKYISPGTYAVKLRATFSGTCVDSIIKSGYIIVHDKPAINFTADTTKGCDAPFKVVFNDLTPDANAWKWNFGDNTTSTAQSPTHTYSKLGNDSVQLKVTSIYGCVAKLTKQNFIQITKPKAYFLTSAISGCAPLTISFKDSSISAQRITSWSWNFNDPNSGLLNSATTDSTGHTFNTTGKYKPKLTITNAYGCKSVDSTLITLSPKPTPYFHAAPLTSCALSPIVFTDSSINATKWNWFFGDNQIGSGPGPKHNYADTGFFTVKMLAYNGGCAADTVIKTNYVYINSGVPKFQCFQNCNDYTQRTISNNSIGADKFYWDFGDTTGIDSINVNPTHSYKNMGQYKVNLKVINTKSGCTADTNQTVLISKVTPKFTVLPQTGCAPLLPTFSAVVNNDSTWNYFFEFDNKDSMAFGPVVQYNFTTPGFHNVKLIVINTVSGCKDSTSNPTAVNVLNMLPKVGVISQMGCDSLTVNFVDSSQAGVGVPITAWAWDFGDSKTSQAQSPTHKYKMRTRTGNFQVSLVTTNTEGSCASPFRQVNFTLPIAKDSITSVINCPGMTINYGNGSKNANKYQWSFGDTSKPLTTLNGSHYFSKNGIYPVKLIAMDSITGCKDSSIVNKSILIHYPKDSLVVSSALAACPPYPATFRDIIKTSSPIVSSIWYFGDGNQTETTGDTATNTYVLPGIYSVKVISTNSEGCSDTLVKPNYVTVHGPNASFSLRAKGKGCSPDTAWFDLNMANTFKYTLSFGDGGSFARGTSPTFTSNAGADTCCIFNPYISSANKTYHPILVAFDSLGCSVNIPLVDSIQVIGVPKAQFIYSPAYPNPGQMVTFTDQSGSATSWKWTFGDSTALNTSENPQHDFTKSGVFYTKFVVSNLICKDSITKSIAVTQPLLVPNFFSPNGDGIDDTFKVDATGITGITLHIFDRWGLEVYYKTADVIAWDGHNMSGVAVPVGTYFYSMTGTDSQTKQTVSKKGFFELFH